MILSSLVRSFKGAAKGAARKVERRRAREPADFPNLEPDRSEWKEMLLPPEGEDLPEPPFYGEEGILRQEEKPVPVEEEIVKEVKVRTKPRFVPSVRGEQKDVGGELGSELNDLLHGDKIPLAFISAVVFSPPRSKRRFRPNY